jgi:hypothetical protein
LQCNISNHHFIIEFGKKVKLFQPVTPLNIGEMFSEMLWNFQNMEIVIHFLDGKSITLTPSVLEEVMTSTTFDPLIAGVMPVWVVV